MRLGSRHDSSALQHRETLYAEPNYRFVHAEADGMPGVIIDRFGDVAVVQPNAAMADVMIETLVDALVEVTGVGTVIMNGTGRARSLEGLEERTDVLRGTAPTAPIPVPMNGATYLADVMGGQKTGIFFDQRPNHAFAASLVARVRACWMCLATLAGLVWRHWPMVQRRCWPLMALRLRWNWRKLVRRRWVCRIKFETRRGDAFATS